jgi:hypothetical protein
MLLHIFINPAVAPGGYFPGPDFWQCSTGEKIVDDPDEREHRADARASRQRRASSELGLFPRATVRQRPLHLRDRARSISWMKVAGVWSPSVQAKLLRGRQHLGLVVAKQQRGRGVVGAEQRHPVHLGGPDGVPWLVAGAVCPGEGLSGL